MPFLYVAAILFETAITFLYQRYIFLISPRHCKKHPFGGDHSHFGGYELNIRLVPGADPSSWNPYSPPNPYSPTIVALGGDCEKMMVAATLRGFDFGNSDLWGNSFHGNHYFSLHGNAMGFNGRLKKFEHNMKRLGRRMDNKSCNCPASVTQQIKSTPVSDEGNFIKY